MERSYISLKLDKNPNNNSSNQNFYCLMNSNLKLYCNQCRLYKYSL